MADITINKGMQRIIINTDNEELLLIKLHEVVMGAGRGDGSWDETTREVGRIDLSVDDVKVLNDVIERWMYDAIDRKAACYEGRGPRMG